ncbi:hypothetical protein ADL12_15145 [Streptomyces regalis]|uniref:Uncharacterized protein n=1 Tax=Streptomyces regalis TaxID=68262 RepID=A0A0X3V4J2_9ACTN|nr:hypothetical protein ADL12_15145 [Streptomyces regalis]
MIIGSWLRATPSVLSHTRRLRGRCRIKDGAGGASVLRLGRGNDGGATAQGVVFEGQRADGLLVQGEGAAQVGVLLP